VCPCLFAVLLVMSWSLQALQACCVATYVQTHTKVLARAPACSSFSSKDAERGCAGVCATGRLQAIPLSVFQDQINVNFLGAVAITQGEASLPLYAVELPCLSAAVCFELRIAAHDAAHAGSM